MRCRRCDYELWNIATRTCPECGDPFLPSDFTFRPNAVEFRCPHCQQTYFGAGERGHLDPAAFACVSCARQVAMDEMVLVPAPGVNPDAAILDRQPWIHRAQIGFWRAWWRTTIMGMVNPVQVARCTPPDASLGAAWRFASFNHLLVVGTFGALYILFFILMMGITFATAGGGGGMGIGTMLIMVLTLVAVFAVSYLIALLFLAAWIGVTHLFLRITGGAGRPIRATSLAILYTSGAYLPNLVPCLNYVSWLWWPITAGIALKDMQGVAAWRAVCAALFAPVVTVVALVAAYAAFVAWMMTLTGAGMTTALSAAQTQLSLTKVHAALSADALSVADPRVHALNLIADGRIDASDVIRAPTLTTTHDVPVADTDLAEFLTLPPSEQAEIADAAAAALPRDVIAHRLGDLVLTYHGIDHRSDFLLWTAIVSPDPDANPGADAIDDTIWVLLVSGGSEPIDAADFDRRLAEQNDRRARSGLAPLPHPYDIRHAFPAAAGDAPPPDPDP